MTSAVQHDFLVRRGDRQEIAERTIACRLEKPPEFPFKPGQFIEITLLNPRETDSEMTRVRFLLRACRSRAFSYWQPGCANRRSRRCYPTLWRQQQLVRLIRVLAFQALWSQGRTADERLEDGFLRRLHRHRCVVTIHKPLGTAQDEKCGMP